MLNFLPDEIVDEIFQFLPSADIISLSRTCKRFHTLITKSKLLASKLTLCFEKHRKYFPIGKRKYSQLKVGFIDPATHYLLLKLIGEGIVSLSFSDYDFKLDTIRRVLVLCKNVKFVKFEEILRVHGVAECDTSNLPQHRNLTIECFNSDPRIFKALRNCTARKLTMSCPEFALRHFFIDLIAFLKNQRDLVELSLSEFIGPLVSIGIILFGSETLAEIDFKLKTLDFKTNELIPCGNISTELFFELFMEAHKETLEVLRVDRLEDFDFTNYLKDCNKLRDLSIGDHTKISSKQLLPGVTRLEIEYQRMYFLKAVPNLRELKINSNYDDPHSDILKWYMLSKCPLLERLEVQDLPMDDFPIIPSLKALKLDSILHLDSEIFSRNPQIEELTFVFCNELLTRKSKVLKIIVGYLRELRSLTIVSGFKIDPSAIKYVKAKCTKLKKFIIYRDVDCEIVEIY